MARQVRDLPRIGVAEPLVQWLDAAKVTGAEVKDLPRMEVASRAPNSMSG